VSVRTHVDDLKVSLVSEELLDEFVEKLKEI
jgi:hypothetical protein